MAISFDEAILLIKQELNRAEKIHPVWPTDKIHAAAIVSEESGELVQACNNYKNRDPEQYETALWLNVKTEAIHTAVTAIRFLINM